MNPFILFESCIVNPMYAIIGYISVSFMDYVKIQIMTIILSYKLICYAFIIIIYEETIRVCWYYESQPNNNEGSFD